ncbi:MAG: hypothetical protein GX604_10590 [Actinobacteria bacterium]|nr:hypothetical protein [Actinomycetota bacterium]
METRVVISNCPLCEAHCGLEVEVVGGRVTAVYGHKHDPDARGFSGHARLRLSKGSCAAGATKLARAALGSIAPQCLRRVPSHRMGRSQRQRVDALRGTRVRSCIRVSVLACLSGARGTGGCLTAPIVPTAPLRTYFA